MRLFFLILLMPLIGRSQALAPLSPVVVRLAPGDVVRQPLIGLDTTTYGTTRRYVATAGQLLDVRRQRLAEAARLHQLDSLALAAAAAELQRCRGGAAATEADYASMRAVAGAALAVPPRPPWLLDSHTYRGVAVGGVLAVVLRVFLLH